MDTAMKRIRAIIAPVNMSRLIILAALLVLTSVACGGVSKPRVATIPDGWDFVEEYRYGAYNLNGVKLGGMLYEDHAGSMVLLMYGDIPGFVTGGSEQVDPLTKFIETSSIFDSLNTGHRTVAGRSANYYKSCEGNWCEMGISFIEGSLWLKGATWIGIYVYYDTDSEDAAMSLIDSIYFD